MQNEQNEKSDIQGGGQVAAQLMAKTFNGDSSGKFCADI